MARFNGSRYVPAILVALGLTYASSGATSAPTKPIGSPSDSKDSSEIQRAAERVAQALEAKNRYDQSPQAQRDAHEAALGAREAARWAGAMFWVGLVETVVTLSGVALVALTLNEARKTATETKNAADAAKQSLELARRPRIVIRNVTTHAADTELDFAIAYVNKGEETAYVHRLDCELFTRRRSGEKWDSMPFIRDIEGDAQHVTVVLNGQLSEQRFERFRPRAETWARIRRGDAEMFLIGHARYEDARKITRRTGFMWIWDPKQEQFLPTTDDSRWSYED